MPNKVEPLLPQYTSCPQCGNPLPSPNGECPNDFCLWKMPEQATKLEERSDHDDNGGLNYDHAGLKAMPLSAAQWEKIADFIVSSESVEEFNQLIEIARKQYCI